VAGAVCAGRVGKWREMVGDDIKCGSRLADGGSIIEWRKENESSGASFGAEVIVIALALSPPASSLNKMRRREKELM